MIDMKKIMISSTVQDFKDARKILKEELTKSGYKVLISEDGSIITDSKKETYDEKLFLELDKKFHLSIIRLSRNKFVIKTYTNIRDYITITERTKKERVKEVFNEHESIVEALSQNNIEKVKEAIKEHLNNSKSSVLEYQERLKTRDLQLK